ncbi:MAG: mammalian cell entry protein, partial [Actinomycetota bacterium]|nr:mammalian cell entry protein [Actinomycetota bacterium]
PEDTTTLDTPDGLYCKLPQDSPMNVRGARNYPCMGHPGKRAPTVELCNDPRGFVPLAMRQHILGAYPFDPNLVAQGVPLDDRVDFEERIYAPVEGTPLPPGAVPAGTPPLSPELAPTPLAPELATEGAPPAPAPVGPPPPPAPLPPGQGPLNPDQAVPAAPSAFGGGAEAGPSVASAPYDPQTGRFLSPDGQLQQLTSVGGDGPKSWTDLMPT